MHIGRKVLSSRAGRIALGILVLLVLARIAAPWVLERYVERRLDRVEGYGGRVGDIDLRLWRGGYRIEGLEIVRDDRLVPVPLYSAAAIDLHVHWRQLLKGHVVGEMVMTAPVVHFVDSEDDERDQTGEDRPWTEVVRDLFPFRIDQVTAHEGKVHFHNFETDPKVDVYLENVTLIAFNLTNSEELAEKLPSKLRATALPMGEGGFMLDLWFDPFREEPTFDLDAQLLDLDVSTVAPLLRAYAPVDLESGTFDLIIEVEAVDGQLDGYYKPMFRDLVVFDWNEDVVGESNPLRAFWEAVVGTVELILENPSENQLATRIPISGEVGDAKRDLLALITGILKNAFVRALMPELDRSVGR